MFFIVEYNHLFYLPSLYNKRALSIIQYQLSLNLVKVFSVDIFFCLLNDKKSTQKVWSKDLVYKGTFRLSSRTPHAYKFSYELTQKFFLSFKYLNL